MSVVPKNNGKIKARSDVAASKRGITEKSAKIQSSDPFLKNNIKQSNNSSALSECLCYGAKDEKLLQAPIASMLCEGKEYAQTAKQIAKMIGAADTRIVTRQIERERLQGVPICAGDSGYYLPRNADELENYTKSFNARRKHISNTAIALEYALAKMQGQEMIKELEDGR